MEHKTKDDQVRALTIKYHTENQRADRAEQRANKAAGALKKARELVGELRSRMKPDGLLAQAYDQLIIEINEAIGDAGTE